MYFKTEWLINFHGEMLWRDFSSRSDGTLGNCLHRPPENRGRC